MWYACDFPSGVGEDQKVGANFEHIAPGHYGLPRTLELEQWTLSGRVNRPKTMSMEPEPANLPSPGTRLDVPVE